MNPASLRTWLSRLTALLVLSAAVADDPSPATEQTPGASTTEPTTRALEETELRLLLTTAAQDELDPEQGELELRFARTWSPILVPDLPLSVRLLDFPRGGLRPYLLLRFDLLAGAERIGGYQMSLQASLWRQIPVARSNLRRGQQLHGADVSLERSDVLTLRDTLEPDSLQNEQLEIAQFVRAGQPIPSRAVRIRPVIRRGSMVEALMADGLLLLSLKVEALEDAVPGQIIGVRNPRNRREYQAKVQNEQSVLLLL